MTGVLTTYGNKEEELRIAYKYLNVENQTRF